MQTTITTLDASKMDNPDQYVGDIRDYGKYTLLQAFVKVWSYDATEELRKLEEMENVRFVVRSM